MVKAAMIQHMNVPIDDVDRARDFYGRVLGLPEIKRPNVGRPGLWFGCGANELHLSVQPGLRGGRTTLSLQPNDRPDRSGGHAAFTMSGTPRRHRPAPGDRRRSRTCAGRPACRRSSAKTRPAISSS